MSMISSQELIRQTGLSYRQIQFWSSRGWLRPYRSGARVTEPGTRGNPGYTYLWPAREAACARVLARLLDAGLSGPAAAEVVATLRAGERRHQLAPGVWITIRKEWGPADGYASSHEERR